VIFFAKMVAKVGLCGCALSMQKFLDFKIFVWLVVAVVGVANSEPPSSGYGTPLGSPLGNYGNQNYEGGNGHHDNDHGEVSYGVVS
jgi:hypothetical protein